MTKRELRIKYKALRANFTEEQIEERSLDIVQQLLKIDIWNYTYYHLFLPIKHQKEINTNLIFETLEQNRKKIVLSKSDFEDNTLQHFLFDNDTQIKLNKYGIPEPENGTPISAQKLDIVFIPLLAFDKKGNRVGYGKGFYDRFLASCKPEILKVGLSFFEAEEIIADAYPGDIPLDICVTPNRIYNF